MLRKPSRGAGSVQLSGGMGSRRSCRPLVVLAPFVVAAACAADPGDDPKGDGSSAVTGNEGGAGSGGSSGNIGSSGSSTGTTGSGSSGSGNPRPPANDAAPSGTASDDAMSGSTDVSEPPPPPSCPTCPLRVDYYALDAPDSGIGSTQTIGFHINIANMGSMAQKLSELTVRYWFTAEGDPSMKMECYYAGPIPAPMTNVQGTFMALTAATMPAATATADTYLEISFTAAAGSIAAGGNSGDIQLAVHDTNYGTSRFNEANDYSYNPANAQAKCLMGNMPSCLTSTMTLYRGGVLTWGTEPDGTMPAGDL